MLTPQETSGPDPLAARAQTAADSVEALFARRFWLPGSRLGRVAAPGIGGRSPWHYWWQAHYLDHLIDVHLRLVKQGSPEAAAVLSRAGALARGIWARNGLRWTNSYFDDMAWLALALQRLDAAAAAAGRRRSHRRGLTALGSALRSAATDDFGGGVFWNVKRDFKNTPATAPAALYFVRAGDPARAEQLLQWLRSRLWDSGSGLYLDGLRNGPAGEKVVRTLYSYNQGPTLGALVEVGGAAHLEQAASLIEAVAEGLTTPEGALRAHGSGDGGLFTGILARYLADAALAPGLAPGAARTARRLITATADSLWEGRAEARYQGNGASALIFPAHPGESAELPVDLSTQLQAGMVFEAAARLPGSP